MITFVKFANAVSCGSETLSVAKGAEYAITLDGNTVKIEHKTSKKSAYTTLYNVCYWHADQPAKAGK